MNKAKEKRWTTASSGIAKVGSTPIGSESINKNVSAQPERGTVASALAEAQRYFRNRPGNEETQLAEVMGNALRFLEVTTAACTDPGHAHLGQLADELRRENQRLALFASSIQILNLSLVAALSGAAHCLESESPENRKHLAGVLNDLLEKAEAAPLWPKDSGNAGGAA